MRTITINGLKPAASVIGLGTMIFHPDTRERDFALLDSFVKGGGTYIDTAEVYGAVEEHGYSEKVIGEWLASRPAVRKRIILATKGLIPGYCKPLYPEGASIGPDQVHRAIDGSLERLRTDYLDIWMFHRDDPTLDTGPLVDALDEEVRQRRIRAWGASNWTTARLRQAIDYCHRAGKALPAASSPQFSLARANEPYWPNTVVTSPDDQTWYQQSGLPLIAWSSLGRGFFAHGDPRDTNDRDLVRVFYSADNFERKRRAAEFGKTHGLSLFEVALAWVTSQDFPVVALCGARTNEQVRDALAAGSHQLNSNDCAWLDLETG